jgi:Cd2+/Zn2+-exporting ATPase
MTEVDHPGQTELTNIIVSMEKKTNHPLAHALVNHFDQATLYDIEVETIPGKGIRAHYEGHEYGIGKPTIFNLTPSYQAQVEEFSHEGKTVIMLVKNEIPVVMIALLDVAKDSAKQGLNYFNERGIATVMITGDNALTAKAIGEDLGITKIYANVLPEEKQNIVKELKETYGLVAMIGDGINDAPALVEATLGIAMGDGTDVAIDVADGVLVNNDFLKLTLTHAVSRKLKHIVVQNIVFAMVVVALLIGMNFFFTLPMGAAVAIHEGSTVLVILNGLRLLKFRDSKK